MAGFDWKKLSSIDKVVVGAGGVGLIALFLPWFGVSSGPYSATVSGWSAGIGLFGGILIVAAGVYVALLRSGTAMPKTSIGPGMITLGLSGIGAVLVLLHWISAPRASYGGALYSYGPRYGMILELLAGLVQAGCAFTLFRRSGESAPWQSKS